MPLKENDMSTVTATSSYVTTINDHTSNYDINSTAPAFPTPWLNTSQDLVVYVSVICGILGFVLLLAILGWVLDQTAQYGDPVGEKLCKICRKSSDQDHSSPFGVFPHAQTTDDPDMPRWVHGIHRVHYGSENKAFEVMDQTIEAQHQAAEHLGQIRSEMSDVFSVDEYDIVGSEMPVPRPVRPSEIAAYERKSKRKSKKQPEENEHDTQIPSSPNGHQRINSNPQSEIRYFQDPESNMYQTRFSVKQEDEYGGSLYSNIETSPTVPPRK